MKIRGIEIREEIAKAHPEPKCPGCGAGVLRPKCLYEFDPVDCPRHKTRYDWERDLVAAEKVERLSEAGDIPLVFAPVEDYKD